MPDIVLTASAAEHLAKSLKVATQGQPEGVRLGVKKAGCSGYEYVVEYAYQLNSVDRVFSEGEARLIVDAEILEKFLKGTTVDYRKEGVNHGLFFDNPNVEAQCGCGESFTLKTVN